MPSIPVAVAASLVLTIHPRMPFTLIAGLFVLPVTQMDPSAAAPRLPRTSYAPSIREPLPSRPTSVRWRGRRCPRARSRIARGFREWLTASPVQKALAQILSCCTTTYYQRGIPEIQLGTYPYLSRKSAKKQRFFSTANARFYYATSYNIKRYLDPIATHSPLSRRRPWPPRLLREALSERFADARRNDEPVPSRALAGASNVAPDPLIPERKSRCRCNHNERLRKRRVTPRFHPESHTGRGFAAHFTSSFVKRNVQS